MNGSSRSRRGTQNHQTIEDYWLSVHSNWNELPPQPLPWGLLQTTRLMNLRERRGDYWALFEERLIRGSNYSLVTSGSSSAPIHPQIRFPLIDNFHHRPSATPYGLPFANDYNMDNLTAVEEERSKFSEEEQSRALKKLRKKLYSPHLSSIIKRLGTSSSSMASYSNAGVDEEGKKCTICLEDFDTKQFVMVTPCNHMFHEECIVPWVKSNGKCPVCRFVIITKQETSRDR